MATVASKASKLRKARKPNERTTQTPKKLKSGIKNKSKTKSSTVKRKASPRRVARTPSSIPHAFSRNVFNNNQLYLREGRHIRSRRSVMITSNNASFPSMMHSISIISPIEDFDDKELNAWEKLMNLEGKSELVNIDDEQVEHKPIESSLTKPLASYCFSLTLLVSLSILLSAIVMILSMSFYVVCVHLNSRSTSPKMSNIY